MFKMQMFLPSYKKLQMKLDMTPCKCLNCINLIIINIKSP